MPRIPRDDQLQLLLANMETIHKLMRTRFMREMRAEDGLHSHFVVLYVIATHEPTNSRKLGQILFITPGAVTQAVDALVKDGLVQRQPNAIDRRVTDLTLTDAGKTRFAAMQAARQKIFEEVFTSFTDEEIQAYLTAQNKMLATLQETQDKDGKE